MVSQRGADVWKILVVEDAQIVREPLARLLQAEGFAVTSAADGTEAMVQVHAQPPDLILLDVLMPRMHGVAFLEALRGDPRYKRISVIGLTGISDTSKLTRLRELGVIGIVHKVRFSFDNLVTQIRDHLTHECHAPV